MAVGDNYNDREMLEWAGTGVAMGNSVAELLEGAFHITGTNDEAGLAQAIDRHALDVPRCNHVALRADDRHVPGRTGM